MTPNDKTETNEDDAEYVSPLFDETVKERYERIRRIEAEMSDEEILERLHQSAAKWDRFLSGETDTPE